MGQAYGFFEIPSVTAAVEQWISCVVQRESGDGYLGKKIRLKTCNFALLFAGDVSAVTQAMKLPQQMNEKLVAYVVVPAARKRC